MITCRSLPLALLLASGALVRAQETPANLAAGRPYVLQPAPNYDYCTDDGDATQLTDGRHTGLPFWTQKSTVGWAVGSAVSITVDLGREAAIGGARFSTAAGHGGVSWPWSIVLLTSSDGQRWQRAGDLARANPPPPATEAALHRYAITDLRTHGRYVRFLIGRMAYIFVDEIEVLAGPAAWLSEPPAGREVRDMTEAALEAQGVHAMLERLRADLAQARAAIEASPLPADRRRELLREAARLGAEIEALPNELPAGFKTLMPFSPLQARIFALHAPARRAAGLPGLCLWPANRWDPLLPTQGPPGLSRGLPGLKTALLPSETRSVACNLTNSTDRDLTVSANVQGLPGGDNPAWVSVREVQYSDTYVRRPIAAALPVARRTARGHHLRLPAGMTRQVWLQLAPATVPPGRYQGEAVFTAASHNPLRMALEVTIHDLAIPADIDLAVGGWDYTEGEVSEYDAAHVDQQAFIAKLREYGVNTPWSATPPSGAEFDAAGALRQPPDFTAWDRWVAKWPGARHYAVFGLGRDFEGQDPATPRGRRMVGEWLRAWVAHLQTQGLRPDQLLLLLVDEPRGPEFDAALIPWAEAVRAAQTGVQVWEDPCHEDPAAADPRIYELSDILSPSAARFVGSPPSYRDFFLAPGRAEKLWFYSCVNGKHLDPITYYRGQFWLAIRHGARGSCYWAFGDEGRGGNSFRAYTAPGHMFSPLFLDPPAIIDGKHMEAIREGRQDWRCMEWLRRRVAELTARGVKSPDLETARRLLVEGPERVTQEITLERLDWNVPKDRGTMDEVRQEALTSLERLRQW